MAFEILNTPSGGLPPIRGILFDMDGLVLDTEVLYCRYWQEASEALGCPMTRDQALGMRSLNALASQEKLDAYFGPGRLLYQPLRAERIRRMDAWIAEHGVAVKPGARELLQYLQEQHISAALATSSPMDRVRDYLGRHKLLDCFQALCSGYDVPRSKPEPDIFLMAADRLGLPPENCLVLEDSPAGILSASRAGCHPVIVPDQDQPDGETLSLCFARADSLLDIINLLRSL